MQRIWVVGLLLSVATSGCISLSSSDPSPPQKTTVVVPSSSAPVVCDPSPCR